MASDIVSVRPMSVRRVLVVCAAVVLMVLATTLAGGVSARALETGPVDSSTLDANGLVAFPDEGEGGPGAVRVSKIVTGDAAQAAGKIYELTVDCSFEGDSVWGSPWVLSLAGGESEIVPAPIGSTCSVHEADAQGATATLSAPVTITSGSTDTFVLWVSNDYAFGDDASHDDTSGVRDVTKTTNSSPTRGGVASGDAPVCPATPDGAAVQGCAPVVTNSVNELSRTAEPAIRAIRAATPATADPPPASGALPPLQAVAADPAAAVMPRIGHAKLTTTDGADLSAPLFAGGALMLAGGAVLIFRRV